MLDSNVVGKGRFPLKQKPPTLKEQIQDLLKGNTAISEELRPAIEAVKTLIHSLSREQKKSLQTQIERSTGMGFSQATNLSTEKLLEHLLAGLDVIQTPLIAARVEASAAPSPVRKKQPTFESLGLRPLEVVPPLTEAVKPSAAQAIAYLQQQGHILSPEQIAHVQGKLTRFQGLNVDSSQELINTKALQFLQTYVAPVSNLVASNSQEIPLTTLDTKPETQEQHWYQRPVAWIAGGVTALAGLGGTALYHNRTPEVALKQAESSITRTVPAPVTQPLQTPVEVAKPVPPKLTPTPVEPLNSTTGLIQAQQKGPNEAIQKRVPTIEELTAALEKKNPTSLQPATESSSAYTSVHKEVIPQPTSNSPKQPDNVALAPPTSSIDPNNPPKVVVTLGPLDTRRQATVNAQGGPAAFAANTARIVQYALDSMIEEERRGLVPLPGQLTKTLKFVWLEVDTVSANFVPIKFTTGGWLDPSSGIIATVLPDATGSRDNVPWMQSLIFKAQPGAYAFDSRADYLAMAGGYNAELVLSGGAREMVEKSRRGSYYSYVSHNLKSAKIGLGRPVKISIE